MMSVLDELRAEHETILDVMDGIENSVLAADETTFSESYLEQVLDFIWRYIERNHHGKEERALFPRMRDNPFLREMSEALHQEHEEGAALVAALERALDEDRAPEIVARELVDYIGFLRGHIRRENEMIFEAVERVLDESTAAEILAEFRAIGIEALGTYDDKAFANLRMSALATRRR